MNFADAERAHEAYVDGPLHDAHYADLDEPEPCPDCGAPTEPAQVRRGLSFYKGFQCTDECGWDFEPGDNAGDL